MAGLRDTQLQVLYNDLLKEINVVGLDSQQYCWGRA